MKLFKFTLCFIIFLIESNLSKGQNRDFIYCNVEKSSVDRFFLFDKSHFIRIHVNALEKDSIIYVVYGNYKTINDTIVFTIPDSLENKNKYFGFYKTEFESNKSFHINQKHRFNSSENIEHIYKKMFKANVPNYLEFFYFTNFRGIRNANQLFLFEGKIFPRSAVYALQ